MIRTLGAAWAAASVATAAAFAATAWLVATAGLPPLALGVVALALGAALLALVSGPLALAPAETLSASLAGRAPGAAPWGTQRGDLWGRLAREIEAATAPPPPPPAQPDRGIEFRRLAANLELTLRQTGEELHAVRSAIGAAATTLEGAAIAGGKLAEVAGEASRQLAEAVQRTDDATGALAVLPALASEQARTIEAAAARTLAAAEALEQAALGVDEQDGPETVAEPPAPQEPSEAERAMHEAIARGADQARRMEAVMPLLLEAIGRLPVAATSQDRLAATAEALEQAAAALAEGVDRIGGAVAGLALPDLSAPLDAAFATLEDRLVEAARDAADAAATRLCDIAELVGLEAGWRAGDAAADAVVGIEAAARDAAAIDAAERAQLAGRLEAVAASFGAAQEAFAGLEAPLAAIAPRLETVAADLAATLADDTSRSAAAALVDRAEALLARYEAAGAIFEEAAAAAAPRALAVNGDEPIDSVAERLLAELGDGEEGAEPPVLLQSLDETIRQLRSVAGAIAQRK